MSENNVTAVDAIKTLVITSLVPLIDKYPLLADTLNSSESENPTAEWDFYMISACAGIILMSNEEFKGEHKAIEDRLNELDKNFMRAIVDLSKFIENSTDNYDEGIATIGYWVIWNIKKNKPTDEELKFLSLQIGNYIMNIVHRIRQEKIGEV